MDLGQVGQLRESVLVAKRDKDHPVVDKSRECVGNGDLLSTTLGAAGNEDTAQLASKSRLAPEWASGIPEGLMNLMRHVTSHGPCRTHLPLHGEVTIASGNTEKEGIKVDEVVGEEDRVVWARRCLDELQDVLGEGLLDPTYHISRRDTWEGGEGATTLTGRW